MVNLLKRESSMNWLTVAIVDSVQKVSVILLTGGTSRRFGSDKSAATFHGKSLMDYIIGQIPPQLPLVIVGPERGVNRSDITFVREEPSGSGPLAGIAAALPHIQTELFFLIATDMPLGPGLLQDLAKGFREGVDAVLPLDGSGVAQPLCALYRTDGMTKAFRAFGDPANKSIKSFVSTLSTSKLSVPSEQLSFLADIDIPDDLARLEEISGRLSFGRGSEGI
jgi:molybdopterin-guanine dinucleotide biosynthesis protein A